VAISVINEAGWREGKGAPTPYMVNSLVTGNASGIFRRKFGHYSGSVGVRKTALGLRDHAVAHHRSFGHALQ
jgi:hypothetical protein